MGGVKKALFGSGPKTEVHDTMRPETEYEKKMREQLTPIVSDMANKSQPYINGAMDKQVQYANGVLPDNVTKNIQTNVGNMVDATVGRNFNNLARRGIIDSTSSDTALNDVKDMGANALNENYMQALGLMSQMNGQQFQMGQGLLAPAMEQYNRWLASRSANPMTVTQTQGSGGLLGGFASGVASGAGAQLGKKWFM